MNKYITLFIFFVILIFVAAFSNESPLDYSKANDSNDSLDAAKKMYVDELSITIKGRENLPSDSVYGDIQMFKEMPAGKLLEVMNYGFSRALGVGCDHCHNTQDFASNEIPAKQIAREMMKMSGEIREMVSKIQEIKNEKASVTCYTCHRGEVIPATKMK